MLGPYDTVNWLTRGVSNGATGKGFLVRLLLALVAFGDALADDGYLAQVAGRARLHQRNVGGQAETVDVASGRAVIQSVQHHPELLKEGHAILGIHDRVVEVLDFGLRHEFEDRLTGHFCLGLAHVVPLKEELTIQVGHVNGVQVDLRRIKVGFQPLCLKAYYYFELVVLLH